MTEHPDRIERTLEVLLYAPIGVGLFLKDTAPDVRRHVRRPRPGRDRPPPRRGAAARHDRAQPRPGRDGVRSADACASASNRPSPRRRRQRRRAVRLARVEPGAADAGAVHHETVRPRSCTRRRAAHPGAARARARAPTTASTTAATPPTPPTRPAPEWTSVTNGDRAASSAELPIPGYDALSASQVVERLIGLAPDELDAVHAYETTHRQRRTILGKIEQLAG